MLQRAVQLYQNAYKRENPWVKYGSTEYLKKIQKVRERAYDDRLKKDGVEEPRILCEEEDLEKMKQK